MSLRRETLSWMFVVGLLLAVAAAAAYIMWPQLQPHTTLRLGDGVFATRVVTIKDDQTNDTITASQLTPAEATLLVYDNEQLLGVTTDNREAAVDLVWLNNAKKVVYIVKNVAGGAMNHYTSTEPARYILELPVGTVGARSIVIGSRATFNEHVSEGGFGR